MKRKHKIKPDFVIDNIGDINNDVQFSTRKETIPAAPLGMVIPGLSSLRTNPIRD